MPQVISPREEIQNPQRGGQRQRWRRDHVSEPGAADRLGLDPGQPDWTGGTRQAATVTAAATTRCRPGHPPCAATSGHCPAPVLYMRSGRRVLGSGWTGPAPRRSAAGTAGPVHAARQRGLRLVPRPVSGQLGTKPIAIYVTSALAATSVRQSHRTVPSPAGAAGVILRGWKLITRPGRHRRPGQCEHCRSRSRSRTWPASASTIRTSATA